MNSLLRLLFAAGVVALNAPRAPAQNPADLAAKARAVLKTHCSRCHSGEGSSSGYAFDVTRHDSLVKPVDSEPALVVGSSLTKSPLWDAIQKRMPQKGSPEKEAFRDTERLAIKAWIEAGASPFPVAVERPFITLKEVLTAIRDHLAKAPPADRPFLRYFSLAQVHNNSTFTDEDLRHLRAALSKVLNSLSWKAPVVIPEAVDKSGTIYVVDIRGLDWDRSDLWRKVIDAYPYGLKYGSHPDRDLRELDKEMVRESGTDLPWVRADWFVATTSRPPLYHDLLQLPKNAKALEEKLGVDIPANFRRDTLARAGFARSGVSGQNRLVERHDTPYGAYWKSYDFLPENGRANLIRFPLGPVFDGNPYLEQAFRHDGGEIIFHLPNGLQGYLLVNGKDERIDTGPIAVVSDDKRVSGTPEIVTGISCMACHRHGMIPFKDVVRENCALFGEADQKVKRLYPPQKAMDERVEADRRKFLSTLEKSIGPLMRTPGEPFAPVTTFKEPVSEVAIGYRRGYLDLKAVTAELFLQDADQLLKKIAAKRLKELGLEPLSRPGGVVGRYQWEAIDGVSLMQEVARELQFTPLR